MDESRAEQRRSLTDIRLQELDFDFDGRKYKLRCNMNVLADVQEDFGGRLTPAVTGDAAIKSTLSFLAAMLNDYAEDMGWPERYTRRELGKKLGWEGYKQLPKDAIQQLVVDAIFPPEAHREAKAAAQGDSSKN